MLEVGSGCDGSTKAVPTKLRARDAFCLQKPVKNSEARTES